MEKDLKEQQIFAEREGLEHYAHQFENNDWNEDDAQSSYIDIKDRGDRLIEYADKHQLHQQVVRMAATNLQGDARILNFDFDVKSLPKRDMQDAEESRHCPLFIGVLSSHFVPPKEDSDDVKMNRFKPPSEFFGCDELGQLYIRGQAINDSFGGFQQGSCVGLELDYTGATPKLFIYVDGFRTACIDREVEESSVPCVVLGALQQQVKFNQGRPRRGKGILISQKDTKLDESSLVVDIMYDVLRDIYCIKSPDDETAMIYNGWNSCASSSGADFRSEYLEKLKAFKLPVVPKKSTTWCVNVALTQAFIESAQFVRGAHVASQKAFNSFYTNTTTHLRRMVGVEWNALMKDGDNGEKKDTGLVSIDIHEDMVYGATQLFVCFNEEDPSQLTPEQDPEITLRLRLTQLYPVRDEKAQLGKLFRHFISVCKQGDGHLLKYHRVELLALRVLSFLRSSAPLRDSMMAEKVLQHKDSAFDIAVRFLQTFTAVLPMYRKIFLRSDVFRFLVKSLAYEDMGISGLLVNVYLKNPDASEHVTPSFVREMMEVLKENLTARPMVSLDALRVLNAVVTSRKDIESRKNGNIVAMEFLKENTVFRLESPFIAMAKDGFLSAKINLKDNRDKIKDYLEQLELRNQARQALRSAAARGDMQEMRDGETGERMDPLGQVSKLELGTQRMFPTTFALASIELMLKCSAFGANRTVLRHFAREVIKCQRPEMEDGGEEDDDDDQESQYGMARQRYFRHVVYWLASDSEQEIPLVVQDAYLRMVCILLQPHEIEDMLHDRWDARSQRLRLIPEKPSHIVLLLIQWFTQYLRRFPELHVFSPRISPVVEAIDAQIAFALTPYFIRDHLLLLLLEVLKAYNEQNVWKRWWATNFLASGAAPTEFALGGPADQPPGADKVAQDFEHMVTNGTFEPQSSSTEGQEKQGREDEDLQDGPDILTQLWTVLFDQRDWCHREWQIDEEMCVCIQQILDLGLCDNDQRTRAYDLLQRIGPEKTSITKSILKSVASEAHDSGVTGFLTAQLQRPWWPQEQSAFKEDVFEEVDEGDQGDQREGDHVSSPDASGFGFSASASGAFGASSTGAGDDFGELWKVTAARVGRHAQTSAQEKLADQEHSKPFRSHFGHQELAAQADAFVMPRGLQMPLSTKVAKEEEDLKDFMYELVELGDAKLAQNLRIDVNLWRRQQLTHPSFELFGTDEKSWNVHEALLESMRSLGMKLFFEENVLMTILMEVHVTIETQDIKEALFAANAQNSHASQAHDGDKDMAMTAMNQVYFEVEVERGTSSSSGEGSSNHSEIIFLENFSYVLGRKKLSLQVLGAETVTMRSRCLFDSRGAKVTVANPRIIAVTSPRSFDSQVIQKVVHLGSQHHALSNEPGNQSQSALEPMSEKKKISRMVIHEFMPRYRNILVDIVEEQCFGLSGGVSGLDHVKLQRILEAEHQYVVAMMNRACSYVMLEHLLTKLDIDRKDWELQVQQTFPNLTRVFETLSEHSVDEMTDSEVPIILYREPEDERMDTLRSWILRICHVVRSVAFTNQPRLSFSEDGAKLVTEDEENIFEKLFDDTGEMLLSRACCASLLNILQEIFTRQEDVEEEWERWTPSQQVSHQFLKSFVVEKAIFFCPFSIDRDLKRKVRLRLLRFFEDAQVEPTDPLRLVPEMLYHPDVWLRLEALKLGCNLLEDADLSLQAAFQQFDFPQLNLQKALAYQFSDFHSNEQHGEDDVQVIGVMLRKLQNLCEGHNSTLQAFVGEDLSIEGKDFATLMAEYLQKSEDDDDDDQDRNSFQNPTNLVEWICTLARQSIEQMKSDQQWQVSMKGSEIKYSMLKQLFDTAAEIVQGPNRGNQRLLLESEILLDVNQLWMRQRIDEFTFRALLQDNEELFEPFMKLLESMRLCEISVLKFLMSLLEEEELDPEDPNFREVSEELVEHKGTTIRRMVEELNPKIICDKVINHWNLSPESRDPIHFISPVQDADEVIENDTAEQIIRTKGEKESTDYPLETQEEHSLELCFLCWALFEGIQQSPEFGNRGLFEGTLDRGQTANLVLHTRNQWATSKSKIYDSFNEAVTKMHHSKYLHFLFGRVEIIRGQRLQKLFFLVPKAIRTLKAQSLIKDWQNSCTNSVDRTGPEAKLQDFSEQVRDEYIGFVEHQYNLSQKPFPLNASGEVMATARSAIVLLTIGITSVVAFLYDGSYSKDHKMGEYDVHYTKKWYVWVLTSLSTAHFVCAVLLVLFHIVAYSQWKIDTGLDQWKEDNPHSHHRLNGIFGAILMLWFFFQDAGLVSKLFLAGTSFLGLHVDFLIYSLHLMYACAQVETLGKVFEALWITKDQVVGTAVLGFCVQYCFLVLGFLTFPKGYGFADMDTSKCSSLMECLLAHLDYGFRSGPVWATAELSWWKFAFDYLYNLVVILILAAIISGIIIDTFANMRADLQEKNDDQQNNCFICGINRSTMERQMVKFEHHVFQEHYMWSYARFLMYLKQAKDSDLNGPESYVKDRISRQDYSFFPINRALSLDSDDEDYSERQVRIKDLEEMRGVVRQCSESSQQVLQLKREVKTVLKESNEAVSEMQKRLHFLSGDVQKKVQDAMLQKAAQEAREK
ncbi:4 [Durusdinium trenchii]|uniref:4 n=1 Tax=Durusdinium trenchii TaxID=1381693 RepID=A0ABP0KPH2_9DINO